jgi:hypothetical protein
VVILPKSTAIICGARELKDKDGLDSDKKILNQDL